MEEMRMLREFNFLLFGKPLNPSCEKSHLQRKEASRRSENHCWTNTECVRAVSFTLTFWT
jgi:hypothetical protein